MGKYSISIALLLTIGGATLSLRADAHGSPERWSTESTDMGCWISRWLGRTPEGTGEQMVGLQIVVGRIIPPRGDFPQAAITQAELEGQTTINVRVVDPTLKEAEEDFDRAPDSYHVLHGGK